MSGNEYIDSIAQPLTLKCGLTLPNRLVKCPMQEVQQPYAFDVPIEGFRKLYPRWAHAKFGLIVTGQIQIDIRHLSTTADVVIHEGSLDEPIFAHWKEWAALAQAGGTPCLAQLAHPGKRGSAAARRVWGAIPAQAPSAVPIKFPPGWFNQIAGNYLYGEVAEMTVAEIDSVVEKFVFGAKVCQKAGFAGVGIHSSHGFLLSQFLSPASNQRTDDYGGSPEKRRYILARIVKAIRDECGPKFCIAVKLNSADFSEGGLSEDEAIEHVRWLCECDLVDFIEISGGNGEGKTSPLHTSMAQTTLHTSEAIRASTAERESYFARFGKRIHEEIKNPIPIQLSGGFRSRQGMALVLQTGVCDLIGLGRAVVIEPTLPTKLLDPSVPDSEACSKGWTPRGVWITSWVPRVVGGSYFLKWFYWNMQRMGSGLDSKRDLNMASEVIRRTFSWLSEVVSFSSRLINRFERKHEQ